MNTIRHKDGTVRLLTMAEAQYQELVSDYSGVCLACGEIKHGDTEGDAQGYTCPECEKPAVMGAENLLLSGFVDFVDEEDSVEAL